ncbi:uncharacterized protein DUF1311 [Kordia periserrulae]|uniref:Uncharacterized protein DUF1311 n=1 Tax=Kordia periserrulae TaxID=701523 RepID=A0A2T6C5M7_9FLAO|nr:lysozyme inhibitor LprI family protein [Kordia periserrulae]PTX63602.1 uncharacterized protein DUF1311 [Kordia periserrulae]
MKKLVLLLALITIQFGFSQETAEAIDKENRKCLENAMPTTLGSVKCEKEATASWQKLMDETLQQLKKHPKTASVNLLFDSQTHWLKFQKADLAFYAAFYHKQYEGGTMTMAAVATHEKQQFRKRTLYLLEFLEVLNEE